MIFTFLLLPSIQTGFATEEVDPYYFWSTDWNTGEFLEPFGGVSLKEITISKEPDFYVFNVSLEPDDLLARFDADEDILFTQLMIAVCDPMMPYPPMDEFSFMEDKVGNKQWIVSRSPGGDFGPSVEYTYDGEWRGEEVTGATFQYNPMNNYIFKIDENDITDDSLYAFIIRIFTSNLDEGISRTIANFFGIDPETGQMQIPVQTGTIPEFPSWAILPISATVTLVALIYRKRIKKIKG